MRDRLHRLTPHIQRIIIGSFLAIGAGRIGVTLGFLPEPAGIAIIVAGAVALLACMLYVLPQSMAVMFGAMALSAVPMVPALLGILFTVDQFPRLREAMNDGEPVGVLVIVAIALLLVAVGSSSFLFAYRWLDRRLS